jgi:predicted Zn finger-like uncharacterized protein
MLKVECESCKAPYQVDERRVPPTGLKMRCPKCGHTFLVTDPSKGAAPAAGAGGAPKPPPVKKPTMVGVGVFGAGGAPPAAPPAPAPVAPVMDDDLALPAVKAAPPKAPPLPGKPTAPAMPAAPAGPPPVNLPGLDDLDLPALAGDVGLPATVNRPKVPPPAPGGGGLSFDMNLPAVPAPGGGFGGDLPSPKGGFGNLDLPSAKPGGGFADLPMAQNNLPAVGGNNLPAVAGNLPVVAGNLPAPKGGGFGEIDLPSVQNDLPQPMGAQAHMPMPVSDDRLMPGRSGGGGAPAMSFGELDLPLVGGGGGGGGGGGAPLVSPPGGGAVSFGELDLPADPSMIGSAATHGGGGGGGSAAGGGLGFGEVDLGGSTDEPMPQGPPPAMSAGSFAFQEASLEAPSGGAPAAQPRPRQHGFDRGSSKAPKIVAAAVALLVVGGAGLQFTPVGAFGYVWISDQLHQGDYTKNATAAADAARKKLAVDTYAAATQVADELAEARKKSPRSRPLAAYAAFVEYANAARFGVDASRMARAETFLSDMPAGTKVPYLAAASAAKLAASGDWEKAKAGLERAVTVEPKDGIQMEIALLRGECALQLKDTAGAIAAFTEAEKLAPSARASFGLARAYHQSGSLKKAKEAAEAALKASPSHAGAHTLRGLLIWALQRDDAAAMKEIAPLLEEKARKTEGPGEISDALAAKGWIMLARDRAGDARAAFDEAVKIDQRNVSALVGQGEVLYADSRFTEALTRFDEAVKKDPTSIQAIIGNAKTKIALERLADAKSQLTAARQKAPKDMGVAMWLGKTEAALGNKTVAEQLFKTAVELADPQSPDAIQAYAAFASFLAASGRTSEAQAKLDEARSKLPDSAQLQRAFGEVAAAQGHFDEAIGHFNAALEKNPGDLGTRFRLGQTYRQMRKLDLATEELDKVAAIDKEYPGIALERGLLFEESGDVQKALEQFQTAFQKAPNDVDLMLRVGAAYVAIGEIDKALPLLNKVKDARPNSAEANHFIGRAYLKQGGIESASAMRYLQRAVELDPNRAEYHLYVAWAANEANPAQLGLARTHVDKALALDKLLADAYWQRGVVERREGAVNDAVKDLKRALELKPSRHEAHATLAECYEDKNDTPNAMAEWARAIAGDDKEPTWRYRYGRLLLDKGQPGEAVKHLVFAVTAGKSAQPRPGWLATAAFEAGEALRKTNDRKQAADMYRFYLELAGPTQPDVKDARRWLTEWNEPLTNE